MPIEAVKPVKRRTTQLAAPVAPSVHPAVQAMTTFRDLLDHLGVPAERVRLSPFPGTATEADVIAHNANSGRVPCELIDYVLVEKAVGFRESLLALFIGRKLGQFADLHNLGLVLGSDGMARVFPGQIRVPDVGFYSWSRLPGGRVPTEAVSPVAPDLAVEVLSKDNTKAEMKRKRGEYFNAGTRQVWEVDPRKRTVTVYMPPRVSVSLRGDAVLGGGDVLPGFSLPLGELFGELDRRGPDAAPGDSARRFDVVC